MGPWNPYPRSYIRASILVLGSVCLVHGETIHLPNSFRWWDIWAGALAGNGNIQCPRDSNAAESFDFQGTLQPRGKQNGESPPLRVLNEINFLHTGLETIASQCGISRKMGEVIQCLAVTLHEKWCCSHMPVCQYVCLRELCTMKRISLFAIHYYLFITSQTVINLWNVNLAMTLTIMADAKPIATQATILLPNMNRRRHFHDFSQKTGLMMSLATLISSGRLTAQDTMSCASQWHEVSESLWTQLDYDVKPRRYKLTCFGNIVTQISFPGPNDHHWSLLIAKRRENACHVVGVYKKTNRSLPTQARIASQALFWHSPRRNPVM